MLLRHLPVALAGAVAVVCVVALVRLPTQTCETLQELPAPQPAPQAPRQGHHNQRHYQHSSLAAVDIPWTVFASQSLPVAVHGGTAVEVLCGDSRTPAAVLGAADAPNSGARPASLFACPPLDRAAGTSVDVSVSISHTDGSMAVVARRVAVCPASCLPDRPVCEPDATCRAFQDDGVAVAPPAAPPRAPAPAPSLPATAKPDPTDNTPLTGVMAGNSFVRIVKGSWQADELVCFTQTDRQGFSVARATAVDVPERKRQDWDTATLVACQTTVATKSSVSTGYIAPKGTRKDRIATFRLAICPAACRHMGTSCTANMDGEPVCVCRPGFLGVNCQYPDNLQVEPLQRLLAERATDDRRIVVLQTDEERAADTVNLVHTLRTLDVSHFLVIALDAVAHRLLEIYEMGQDVYYLHSEAAFAESQHDQLYFARAILELGYSPLMLTGDALVALDPLSPDVLPRGDADVVFAAAPGSKPPPLCLQESFAPGDGTRCSKVSVTAAFVFLDHTPRTVRAVRAVPPGQRRWVDLGAALMVELVKAPGARVRVLSGKGAVATAAPPGRRSREGGAAAPIAAPIVVDVARFVERLVELQERWTLPWPREVVKGDLGAAHRVAALAIRCPNQCSFRGRCVLGACRCWDGFSGADCSTSATKRVERLATLDAPKGLFEQVGSLVDMAQAVVDGDDNVALVVLNLGFLQFGLNVLRSLANVGVHNVVPVVLDRPSAFYIGEHFPDIQFYYSALDTNRTSLMMHRWHSEAYTRLVNFKSFFALDLLRAGFNVLVVDADTVWYESPWPVFGQAMFEPVDMQFQVDYRYCDGWLDGKYPPSSPAIKTAGDPAICKANLNSGLIYARSRPGTMLLMTELFARAYQLPDIRWRFAVKREPTNQQGLNEIMAERRPIVYHELTACEFPDGAMSFMSTAWCKAFGTPCGCTVVMAHLNYLHPTDKPLTMARFGLWELDAPTRTAIDAFISDQVQQQQTALNKNTGLACADDCNGRGFCITNPRGKPVCDCFVGATGPSCAKDAPPNCTGFKIDDSGKACKCPKGFYGDECRLPIPSVVGTGQ